jgi:transposase-like protein
MDETYINVKGVWKYLYRAVDKEGKTVDFLLTAKRDNDVPEKVTMDKSGANKAAIDRLIDDKKIPIAVRQVKYLNNIVEQALARSSASPNRCSDFSHFSLPRTSWPASNLCT